MMDLENKKNAAREIVNRIVEQFGAYIVDFKVNQQGKRTFVKVLITTDQGIALNQIAEISRVMRDDAALDAIFSENFQLEVSSPGIDFPLKSVRDFRRNIGREMNVFHHSVDLRSPLKGTLEDVNEERLIVKSGNESQILSLSEVEFAKVIIKW
ncbi:MAG: hypothetical protein PHG61_01825 [Candidatus Marinimicrobia bacterium]|nr:hypothetical protein [Candidatus Neomarinimicrobiota bacterium]